jgi:uncharacterized protein YjbI with pentapeptide repeats
MKKILKVPTVETITLHGVGGKPQQFTKHSNRKLTDQQFNNMKLTNIIFENCDLTEVDFSFTTLTNVRFYNTSLAKANFNFAELINVKFWWSYVAGATFHKATLKDVHGQYVDFAGVNFLTAIVTNAFIWIGNFTGAQANPEAGFRTKKGGDGQRYKIPVVTNTDLKDQGYQFV